MWALYVIPLGSFLIGRPHKREGLKSIYSVHRQGKVGKNVMWQSPNLDDYRGVNKGLFVLLSRTQAGPGRTVKQEQEEISRNHVQTFISPSVSTEVN